MRTRGAERDAWQPLVAHLGNTARVRTPVEAAAGVRSPTLEHNMTEARRSVFAVVPLALFLAACLPALARAADPQPGPPITIQRAAGPITLDGELSDPGWQGITPITKWYETNVGDNVEPQVKNLAYLTYDDKYLYAGFQFEDPDPKSVRAPIGDHDAMPGSTDYAGVIVDT